MNFICLEQELSNLMNEIQNTLNKFLNATIPNNKNILKQINH